MNNTEDLVQAAFEGRTDDVRRLLDQGVPIDAPGKNWNPLHAAIENEQLECVQLLIARGADVEYVTDLLEAGMTPLAHAVDIAIDGTNQRGGSPWDAPTDIVCALLRAGADPSPGLLVAREYGSEKFLALLSEERMAEAVRAGRYRTIKEVVDETNSRTRAGTGRAR
jgi:ankyrin repeat protein